MIDEMKPCCKWTDDCQGKKDYDGRLLSVSTRYWPGVGGGAMTFDTRTGFIGEAPYGQRPSATAAIVLNYGEPDQYGYGDSIDLAKADFEADTEAEVKSQVEAWVQKQFDDIRRLLASHYANPPEHKREG